jgi:type I restriction enzyme, S subunit
MPRGKKATSEQTAPPVAQSGEVKLTSLLWQIRELCRKHHLQVWKTQSLANQIYQDLLFIYHIPSLCASGRLELNVGWIGDGKLSEISYASLLSLKEPQLINATFKRLWRELQRSVLKDLFEGRDFTMIEIEKKNPERYMALLLDLFRYLASVKLETYDSNAGYTYFKKDLNKAIAKTFGQFYTPQDVTYSVVKEVDPKRGESVLDPSCGSCSFLAEAASYIVKKEGVDMSTAFENLYGTEVEFNIYAEGIMNMFINFGILPDMKEKIREVDALLAMAKETLLYDKIIANPPFGADASTFHEFYFKTEMEPKGKRMAKKTIVNPEVLCEIPYPNTKESAVLFFQYIIQKLKDGGKAGVVMSSTLLNDGNKEMIQWFLESCSLEKIIINPAGTFKEQGTGIETFSFVFTKGKPTTTVSIVMLGEEEKVVRSLTMDQIKEAGWKLQLKEEEKVTKHSGNFECVKLGALVSGKAGENLPPSEVEANPGPYPVVSGGREPSKSYAKYNREGGLITLSKFGSYAGYARWNSAPFWSLGSFTLIPKSPETCIYRYLYYTLHLGNEKLYALQRPGPTTNFYWSDAESLEIPLPPLSIQEQIVASLDRILADPQDSKDCLAFTSNAMDLMLKDPSGKLLEDMMTGLRLKRAHLAAANSVKAQMAALVRSVGQRGYEKKKLSQIASLKQGFPFKSAEYKASGLSVLKHNNLQSGLVELSKNQDYIDSSGETDEYLLVPGDIVVSMDFDCGKVGKIYTNGWVLNQRMCLVRANSDIVLQTYLYWNLSMGTFHDEMAKVNTGTTIKHISGRNIAEASIVVPPLSVQQEVLAILNEMDAERKVLEQMAAKAEERAKFILKAYLTPQTSSDYTTNENGEIVFDE